MTAAGLAKAAGTIGRSASKLGDKRKRDIEEFDDDDFNDLVAEFDPVSKLMK